MTNIWKTFLICSNPIFIFMLWYYTLGFALLKAILIHGGKAWNIHIFMLGGQIIRVMSPGPRGQTGKFSHWRLCCCCNTVFIWVRKDLDQTPSGLNLPSSLGLLNLMIWVIIDECFEPIRRLCETLIVFVSRVRLRDVGGSRGGDTLKTRALVISSWLTDRREARRGPESRLWETIFTDPVSWSSTDWSADQLWEILLRVITHGLVVYLAAFARKRCWIPRSAEWRWRPVIGFPSPS